MPTFSIKKGRDISLKGSAKKEIVEIPFPKNVAVQPLDFKGLKARLSVKVGDAVKVGSPVFSDKTFPEIRVVSPVSGTIASIDRGAKRALLSVVVETDGSQKTESFRKFSGQDIANISRLDVVENLLQGGLWPVLRQRPFSKVANPNQTPKSIFVHAMNTEPLAGDIDFMLGGQEEEFQAGLDIIKKLTDGNVHVCFKEGARSKALTQACGTQSHSFHGPHPAGNVSTHIHYVDPINKGDLVWYVEAQDIVRIASFFMEGAYPSQKVIAVTGEGAAGQQRYVKTVLGSPLSSLLENIDLGGMRCLSGSILTGTDIGPDGFVCFYDSQVTIIPQGGTRKLLGWLAPGMNNYTFSNTFVSAFLPKKEYSLDSDENGSHRAIVLNNVYDKYVALDIMTYFLLKAVISGNIEEAEQLGILECDAEDFALCTFACPSKTDVGGIIAQGLEDIEREG